MARLQAEITANGTPFRRTFEQIKGEVRRGATDISNSFRSMFLGALGGEALRRLVTEVFTDATKIRDTARAYGLTTQEVIALSEAAKKAGVSLESVLGRFSDLKELTEAEAISKVADEYERLAGGASGAAESTEKLAKMSDGLKSAWSALKSIVGGSLAAITVDLPEALAAMSVAKTPEDMQRIMAEFASGRGSSGSGVDIASRLRGMGGARVGFGGSGSLDSLQRIGAFIGGGTTVEQKLGAIQSNTAQTAQNTAVTAAASNGGGAARTPYLGQRWDLNF